MTKDLKIPSKREQGELVRHAEREVFGMKFNRDITSIEYNSLNLRPKAVKIGCTSEKKEKSSLFSLLSTRFALSLPRQITFSDDTKMKLTYDAAGNKLRAEYWTIPTFNPGGPIGPAALGGGAEPQGGGIVGPILPPINQNDPQVVTDYCGNMIYRNDTLTMLLTEEGYVTFDERGEPLYHYYLKDHLGSVRVVLDGDGTVEQVNDYYPSGTLMYTSTNGTVQPYKFGQKELERTLPLDEYDFGARWMDPVVGGRFTTMDPLCEKYYSVSPYAYCGGNPVNMIDSIGMSYDWVQNNLNGKIEWRDDVTSPDNTPNGYSYIGKSNNDILNHFGFTSNVLSQKKTLLAVGREGSPTANANQFKITKTTALLSLEVVTTIDNNVKNESNTSGLIFSGIKINGSFTQDDITSNPNYSFLYGGSLNANIQGTTTYSNLSIRRGPSFNIPGNVTKEASIFISQDLLRHGATIHNVKIDVGYTSTFMVRPHSFNFNIYR